MKETCDCRSIIFSSVATSTHPLNQNLFQYCLLYKWILVVVELLLFNYVCHFPSLQQQMIHIGSVKNCCPMFCLFHNLVIFVHMSDEEVLILQEKFKWIRPCRLVFCWRILNNHAKFKKWQKQKANFLMNSILLWIWC